jgi:tol-pal system protein YbgF
MAPTRTDTDPGRDLGFSSTEQVAGGPVDMYNTAATQFNNGSLNTARRAFQQFLREYPNDALAPNAHYYLAEILVQEERLEEAVSAFMRVPELFPTAEMVPDSYLRLGEVYIRLDQLDDARAYLERVVNSYPGTDAARLAQERLDEIG